MSLLLNKLTNEKYFEVLKFKKIEKIFKFYIPSQDAKVKSLWAPYLTPFLSKDKLTEFCKIFNDSTKLLYNKDFFIPTTVIIYTNKVFNFILGSPQIFYLLQILYNIDKIYKYRTKRLYYITLQELYYIMFIKNSYLLNFGNSKFLLKNYLSLLSTFGIFILDTKNKNIINK